MKTLANSRAALIAAIMTTFGLGLTTSAVHADIETVTVLATQTSLIAVDAKIDANDQSDDLAENFSNEIRNDLNLRLPKEMNEIIASVY